MNQDSVNLALDGVEMGFRVIASKLNEAATRFGDKEIAKQLSFGIQLMNEDSMRGARHRLQVAIDQDASIGGCIAKAFRIRLQDFAPWMVGYINDLNNYPCVAGLYHDPWSIDDDSIGEIMDFLASQEISFEAYKTLIFQPVMDHHEAVINAIQQCQPWTAPMQKKDLAKVLGISGRTLLRRMQDHPHEFELVPTVGKRPKVRMRIGRLYRSKTTEK